MWRKDDTVNELYKLVMILYDLTQSLTTDVCNLKIEMKLVQSSLELLNLHRHSGRTTEELEQHVNE